jgi:hypothetical protein
MPLAEWWRERVKLSLDDGDLFASRIHGGIVRQAAGKNLVRQEHWHLQEALAELRNVLGLADD